VTRVPPEARSTVLLALRIASRSKTPANARCGTFKSTKRRRSPKRSSSPPIAPSNPTPGPGPVVARVPETEGAVVPDPAPVAGAIVVAVVAAGFVVAVVAVVAAVVVVGPGGVSAPKRIVATPLSLAWSPKVSVHTSPIACCAGVGGQGYSAASAVGLFPARSVAGHVTTAGLGPHGGPTVPWTTLKVVETPPDAVVVTTACNDGALQLTAMAELTRPPSITLGCLASVLHSRMFPIELAVKPLPVIVTDCPLLRPVLGVTVMVPVTPAADADIWVPTIVSPPTKNVAAPMAPSRETPRR